MTSAEWLNIQDMFAIFIGPWIVIYLGAAVAGSVLLTVLDMAVQNVTLVRMVGRNDDE